MCVCVFNISDLKQDDALNTTCWPVLSNDKCCQVASLSIERTDDHFDPAEDVVLLKVSINQEDVVNKKISVQMESRLAEP